ncbi:hypothetical protein [Nitrospira sp. M1]
MTVRFQTRREDFPPNVEDLKIEQVVLYFACVEGQTFEMKVDKLQFISQDPNGSGIGIGSGATSIDGVISTRRGNAPKWAPLIGKNPVGEWELTLPNAEDVKNRFKNEELDDILFVITYGGQTPPRPV